MFTDPTQCSKCAGSGQAYNSFKMYYQNCPKCGGSGKASRGQGNSCPACSGIGTIVTSRGVERCLACGGNGFKRF